MFEETIITGPDKFYIKELLILAKENQIYDIKNKRSIKSLEFEQDASTPDIIKVNIKFDCGYVKWTDEIEKEKMRYAVKRNCPFKPMFTKCQADCAWLLDDPICCAIVVIAKSHIIEPETTSTTVKLSK